MSTHIVRGALTSGALLSLVVACAPGTSSSDGISQGAGSGSGGSSSRSPTDGGAADARFGSGGGTFVVDPVKGPPDVLTVDAACQAESASAEEVEETIEVEVPAAFYLMMDISGSMDDCDGCTNGSKWEDAKAAIAAFVNDAGSAGIKVALQFFSGEVCGGYEVPLVSMGELPGNATAVTGAMDSVVPDDSTPTEGALRGVTSFCAQYKQANPDEECVGVLISDGQPRACNLRRANELAPIAADALANDEVRTFTVGMAGADFRVLDAIAEAGNGDCDPNGSAFACDATSGSESLRASLQAIRETISTTQTIKQPVPCEWVLPDPPSGETFDPDLVNVQFSEGNGPKQAIGRVPSATQCTSAAGGWHYDDPANPTKLLVCPDTCAVIQTIESARVELLFGCESKPAIAM